MARAKNIVGRALLDEDLKMSLTYDVKDEFLLTQSGALYIRELLSDGTPLTPWIERPINNLPRFNDYIDDVEDVWISSNESKELHPLTLEVPPATTLDPIKENIQVTSYLRYAFLQPKILGGGDTLSPSAWITLRKGDAVEQGIQMFAFERELSNADPSLMRFEWVTDHNAFETLQQSFSPQLMAVINEKEYALTITNTPEFQPIGETEYFYKVIALQNDLTINNITVSLAQIELKNESESWVRWVFDDSKMNRDVTEGETHDGAMFVDENITMSYSPGGAPITLVGGIEDGKYILLTNLREGEQLSRPLEFGVSVSLNEEVTLTLDRVETYTTSETRPTIVPIYQRDPSALNTLSMVRVKLGANEQSVSAWLPYHHYPFESGREAVRRFQYRPTIIQLLDGRLIEMMFSRRKAPLEVSIALDSFEIDSHLGGFTGKTASILNWRSLIQPQDGGSKTLAVSVNDPQQYGDLWFFQSQWDPPDSASPGLNYTVLGIGNRRGVFQMLFGCCLAVSGMIWAFYVKPMIKRKRQLATYEGTEA
jgi:hypothetical protein